MKKQERITYGSIMAGALLYFSVVDSIDFNFLIDEIGKNVNIQGTYYGIPYIKKYVKDMGNDVITLADGITLDDFLFEDNCTLRDKLKEVAGNEVINYLENFDINKYYEEKERGLLNNRNNLMERANILLISDLDEEYDELVNYGFKNINCFKSIEIANRYFSEHPEELKKYHIIIKGQQNIIRKPKFNKELSKLISDLGILEISMTRYDHRYPILITTDLTNRNKDMLLHIERNTYKEIFDEIIENAFINHTIDSIGLDKGNFIPMKDYINPIETLSNKKSNPKTRKKKKRPSH